jgi:superfamily II DNA or RNA helicase
MYSRESTPVELTFDRGTLLLRGVRSYDGFTFDPRVGCLRAHGIHYARLRRHLLQDNRLQLSDLARIPPRVAWPISNIAPLRAAQTSALEAWEKANHRGVIVMPTGTGKTEVALAAMQRTKIATLIVAPVRDLMHQWHRRILRALGYDAGIVGDSIFNLQPVTVTTYDSAYARMPEMGDRFGAIASG